MSCHIQRNTCDLQRRYYRKQARCPVERPVGIAGYFCGEQVKTLVWLVLLTFFLMATGNMAHAGGDMSAEPTASTVDLYRITAVKVTPGDDSYEVRIQGTGMPTYTMYELVNPLRIVLDVAEAALTADAGLPMELQEGPVARIKGAPLPDQQTTTIRMELFLAEDLEYAVKRDGNDIVVGFKGQAATAVKTLARVLKSIDVVKSATETEIRLNADGPLEEYKYAELPGSGSTNPRLYIDLLNVAPEDIPSIVEVGTMVERIRNSVNEKGLRVVFDSARQNLFSYDIQPVPAGMVVRLSEPSPAASLIADLMQEEEKESTETEEQVPSQQTTSKPVAAADELSDKFSFSGYSGQRITVDFYKIDLHNVFRLIGEISGKNIVVDEGVGGSLTLALEDVPWDFALDIILNLKDLQKEDRYNTIVISPKSKQFVWPEKVTDSIAFKADPITIKKRIETPEDVLSAKQLLSKAQALEKSGDDKQALQVYEKAFDQWPANSEIAKRIASLYLVKKQMNAKAAHYAKEALRIDVNDSDAALLLAVSLANMKRDAEAKEYFDLAVSDDKPDSDALLSYAAFLEKGGNYSEAIAVLERHAGIYGDTLDSFISKARLHDKNGDSHKALENYQSALLSGYPMPEDLKSYIKGRIAQAAKPLATQSQDQTP